MSPTNLDNNYGKDS